MGCLIFSAMKKIYFVSIVAALVSIALSSCNQQAIENSSEPFVEDGKQIVEIITAGVNVSGPEVRSEIGSTGTFTWNEGDNVAYHVAGISTHEYLKTTSDGSGENGKGAYNLTGSNTMASFLCAWTNSTTERDAFAVYPDSFVEADAVNYGQTGVALDMVFPSSYTYAECSGDKTPCPMIATNTTGVLSWDFKQVCAILRVVVNNVPPGTDNLTITVAGKDMHGDFSIASPVTPGTSVVEAKDGSNSTISITGIPESDVYRDGITVNLPLPVGTYDTNITVTCYDDATIKMIQTLPLSYTAARAHGKKLKMNLAGYTVNSTGLQVGFAPGNLQAKVSSEKFSKTVWKADAWRFASTQYEFLGAEGNSTFAVGAWIDLFGFNGESATTTNYGVCFTEGPNANAYGGTLSELLKSDWGTLEIGPYPANFWRASTATSQSKGELHYMLATRSASTISGTANARYAKGSVNGINGLILFPDIYTHPDGVADPTNINSETADFSGNDYSLSDWTKMEQLGCVFLPAAGKRAQKVVSRYSGSGDSNITGWYRINQSAPKSTENAYRLVFTGGINDGVNDKDPQLDTSTQDRSDGMSVRLQRDLP